MEGNNAVITARSLVKRFGDFTAVAGIDFDVRRGEIRQDHHHPHDARAAATKRRNGESPGRAGDRTPGENPAPHRLHVAAFQPVQ